MTLCGSLASGWTATQVLLVLVSKLKAARDRKRVRPDLERLAKRLHRYPINGRRRSLREVSKALASAGFVSISGRPFGVAAVARMIAASAAR